jgi:hypothetical protein
VLARGVALIAASGVLACSLVESFHGYSDDWGKDAGAQGGAWPSGGSGGKAGGAGGTGAAGSSATGGGAGASCATPEIGCPGGCLDPTSDPENCGGCGIRCETELGPLSVCSNGSCSCRPDTVKCGSRCTRLESDPLNCGGCGIAVDPAELCVGGAPTCRPRTSPCKTWTSTGGYTVSCDGYAKCTDIKWDGSHCVDSTGGKSRCYWTSTSIGRCIDGKCEYDGACPSGRIECSSTLSNVKSCFDPKNDSNHCGGCFDQCAADQSCAGGVCQTYLVVQSCDECGSQMKCCGPMPSAWPYSTICISGSICPS